MSRPNTLLRCFPIRILALLVIVPAMIGCKTINTELFIAAEPSAVWAVISAAPSYEHWNPVHVKVEGEFRVGSKVKIHLKDPEGSVSVFDATVRTVE